MDNYNNKTNEDFIKFLVDELETKMSFVQHDDPDDFFDPEQEYGDHITASQEKLFTFIKNEIKASGITSEEEIANLFDKKRTELSLDPIIEDYIERIKVDYK